MESPGTPVWFLTGTEDIDFPAELLNRFSRSEDIDGTRTPKQMYQVFWKRKINECLANVRDFARRQADLERIALQFPSNAPQLEEAEARVVRIFCRRFNGSSVSIVSLSGGLSGSRVFRVTVQQANGHPIITAVAKVALLSTIQDEDARFQNEIARLAVGGYPPLSERVVVGAGKYGGLFYGMVGDTVDSAFDRLAAQHPTANQIPAEIRVVEAQWYAAKIIETVSVSRIRRTFIRDTDLPAIQSQLGGIDISQMEVQQVRVAQCCQHCDCHCANVVFDQGGRPMLIDFGDAGQSFASVDPVTMELSTVFHVQRNTLVAGWPSNARMARWVTLEEYVQDCPFPDFIRACRDWALAEAGSSQEVSAVAYAYGLRQLKYEDTDKALARALIQACIAHVTG